MNSISGAHFTRRVLCDPFAPMSRGAPPLAPTLMFAAPDGTKHPFIDLCGDSFEEETVAGGPCDVFVEVDNALAAAVDASEDDECKEEPVRTGMWYCIGMFWRVDPCSPLCHCRCRCARVCAGSTLHCTRGWRAHVQLLSMPVSERAKITL